MSRKQWGHGFYQGLNKSKKQSTPLAGCAFITSDQQEGVVREKVSDDHYKVSFFSLLTGEVCKDKLVSLNEMKNWDFFTNCKEMRHAVYKREGYTEMDIHMAESTIAMVQGIDPPKTPRHLYEHLIQPNTSNDPTFCPR
jgi:hypothetical protein